VRDVTNQDYVDGKLTEAPVLFVIVEFPRYLGPPFSSRIGEFLGNLSIAEAMGNLFGKRVRMITALAAFIGVAGIIAVQLKVAGSIFEHALGFSKIYGILLAGIIITLYSTLGGIKSVTFTDVIQFLTFATVIPAISYFLLTSLDNTPLITDYFTTHTLFDFQTTFNFSQPQNLTYLFLLSYPLYIV
jgi:Na+/proline symporter